MKYETKNSTNLITFDEKYSVSYKQKLNKLEVFWTLQPYWQVPSVELTL